jgi:hypothetical protein
MGFDPALLAARMADLFISLMFTCALLIGVAMIVGMAAADRSRTPPSWGTAAFEPRGLQNHRRRRPIERH